MRSYQWHGSVGQGQWVHAIWQEDTVWTDSDPVFWCIWYMHDQVECVEYESTYYDIDK